jgi:hypothetical protein
MKASQASRCALQRIEFLLEPFLGGSRSSCCYAARRNGGGSRPFLERIAQFSISAPSAEWNGV